MDYNHVIKLIDNYIGENCKLLQLLYPREFDRKYSNIINLIKKGNSLEQLKKEVISFFSIQGMNDEQRNNILKLFDKEKEKIINVNIKVDDIFILYKFILGETKKITNKYQWVDTAKLMHLYNQQIPLFDSKVIEFLKYLNVNIKHREENTYFHILNIYELINKEDNINNIIKLKKNIYSDVSIKYLNLNKFVDTMMYFINNTNDLRKYNLLCVNHG